MCKCYFEKWNYFLLVYFLCGISLLVASCEIVSAVKEIIDLLVSVSFFYFFSKCNIPNVVTFYFHSLLYESPNQS